MTVICQRCGAAHEEVGSGDATQGHGCAASVSDGHVHGHYGSAVIDMMSKPVGPGANLADGTDPVCDGCIQALDAAGLLGTERDRAWGGHPVGAEVDADGAPLNRWVRIEDLGQEARDELADLFERSLDALQGP
jgi:hypothetical protein